MCLCSSLQAVCGVNRPEAILTSELPPYDSTLSYFCGRPSANKCRPLLQVLQPSAIAGRRCTACPAVQVTHALSAVSLPVTKCQAEDV